MGIVSGKVAMVTGSGAGIGRATALKFAEEGAKVVVSDVNQSGGEETVSLITDAGGEAVFVKCDVSNPEAVNALVAETVSTFGRLDCACNNAGIEGKIAPLTDQTIKDFDAVLSVNLRGVFLCLQAEIRQMMNNRGGAIVNLASVAGLIGFPGLSPYVATKHAVNGLTKNAALEYGKDGIRVNSVCPGGIDTRMLELAGRSGDSRGAIIAGNDGSVTSYRPDRNARGSCRIDRLALFAACEFRDRCQCAG